MNQKKKKSLFQKTGHAGVFAAPTRALDRADFPTDVDGAPVIAFALDPEDESRVYVSTMPPETLSFLTDEWISVADEVQ